MTNKFANFKNIRKKSNIRFEFAPLLYFDMKEMD